jgi:hypothetical protein
VEKAYRWWGREERHGVVSGRIGQRKMEWKRKLGALREERKTGFCFEK